MPQLDKVTFLSQFFWLTIVFFAIYLQLVKFYLPSLARIVKVRHAVSNRTEEVEVMEAASSPATVVYGNAVNASISTFKGRLDTLEKWNTNKLQTVLPSLSPDFHNNIASYQQEALISETLLNNVVSPVSNPVDSSDNEATSKFFDRSVGKVLRTIAKKAKKPVPVKAEKSVPAKETEKNAKKSVNVKPKAAEAKKAPEAKPVEPKKPSNPSKGGGKQN